MTTSILQWADPMSNLGISEAISSAEVDVDSGADVSTGTINDLIVDFSHLGRKTTGIERISLNLFSAQALAPLVAKHVYASSVKHMLLKQWLGLLTVAWSNREAKLLFPGFPPGIPISLLFGRRAIPYIHDLFLLTRPDDLNLKAKLYMRPSFKYAIRNLNVFFVNSQKTEDDLRAFCKPSAKIIKFRPVVENCFDFNFVQRPSPKTLGGPLKLLMLGTLEPRKNYQYALWLHRTLREKWGNDAELHIVGREGWGVDVKRLAEEPNVHYHGYLEKDDIRALAENCNAYLSTSHDEGLGLPLLEMQYSGLPVIAVDIPVFKEVLNGSGLLIPQGDVAGAADAIVDYFTNVYDETTCPARALENIEHWNRVAEADRRSVIEYLSSEA